MTNDSIRKKMRFPDFDYAAQGCYFITIVTHQRLCLFGFIHEGNMILNEAGVMINNYYQSIEERFPKVTIMESVVMPNHFHCMIFCNKDNTDDIPKIIDYFKSSTTDAYIHGVKEKGWRPFHQHLWQRTYWDDIIWNGRQFEFVKNYIALNPYRWQKDNINVQHDIDVDHILWKLKTLR
ncbi:transposase [Prevotella sp. AGR2160]|uniref:transposase n=1 Tax=Prevotella sp. AGR2160 TaxID=1280674 RepID=UPI0006870ED2|nr:transposase [Prevotella sp. AGR2160]